METDTLILMVDQNRTSQFAMGLQQADVFKSNMTQKMSEDRADSNFWDERMSWVRPYRIESGVLTIPVKGSLLHDFPFQLGSWATGYEYIHAAIDRAMEDDDVDVIALEINSPGGLVSGNFDLSEKIAASRNIKPIRAYVNELAASAAYSIASAATDISVPQTGRVGSIGVVRMHIDQSEMLERVGIKPTFIFAGKHKVDGNSLEPLEKSVKEKWKAEVESTYDKFVALVANNRGMDEAEIRNTEAEVYQADDALKVGLVDRIAPHPTSPAAFAADLETVDTGEDDMAGKPEITQNDAAITQAAHDEAVANARQEGKAEGVRDERTRINTILGSDEAKDRSKAALSAALKTDMTAEQAKAFLADLPVEKTETPADPEQKDSNAGKTFEDAMNGTENPDISAEGGDDKENAKLNARIERVMALRGQAKQ